MWQKFIQKIDTVGGRSKNISQFQSLNIAIPFTWGVATHQQDALEYWNFCDQLPKWSKSNVYFPSNGSFVSSYQSWLNTLTQQTTVPTDLKSQVKIAHKEIETQVNLLSKQYKSFKSNAIGKRAISQNVNEWVQSNPNQEITKVNTKLTQLLQTHTPLTRGKSSKNYMQVWAAFNDPKNFKLYTDASHHIFRKRLYDWSETPLSISKLNTDNGNNSQVVIDLDHFDLTLATTPSMGRSSLPFNKGVSGLPFIRTASGKSIVLNNGRKSAAPTKLTGNLTLNNVKEIKVSPDPEWFEYNYMKLRMKGPYNNPHVVGFKSEANDNQTYFFGGREAIFPSVVRGILVGFEPNFKLSGSTELISSLKNVISQQGGIYIGPILFSNKKDKGRVNLNANQNSISSVNSTNQTPMILGIKVTFFS